MVSELNHIVYAAGRIAAIAAATVGKMWAKSRHGRHSSS
jgi:hypothetical protein